MVNHSQIYNDMLTFRDNACSTSIIYSVQKTTPPFRVYPAGRSLTTTQKMQFLNLIKMFLPPTGLYLRWGMGESPLFARQKLASSPTWKNSPNRLHHSVHFPSNKGLLGKRVMTFFRG